MPFQSEKQRRYLWANEPEIARDWADTYGSRIESNTGGISRLGFAERGSTNKEYLDFKKWFDSQQQQGQEESIHELYQQYQQNKRDKKVYDQKHMAATGGIMRLGFANGPAGGASAGGDYGGEVNPQQEYAGRTFAETYGKEPVGGHHASLDDTPLQTHIQNIGAAPGMNIAPNIPVQQPQGFFGNLKDKIFQGRGDYETQADWQAAKDERIAQKRIDKILNRSDEFPITENTYKNLMDAGWEGGLPSLGSTATSRGSRNTMKDIAAAPEDLNVIAKTGLETQVGGKDNSYLNWLNKNQSEIQQASWREFLQDETAAAMFDPAIHNSWQDVYHSWLENRST